MKNTDNQMKILKEGIEEVDGKWNMNFLYGGEVRVIGTYPERRLAELAFELALQGIIAPVVTTPGKSKKDDE